MQVPRFLDAIPSSCLIEVVEKVERNGHDLRESHAHRLLKIGVKRSSSHAEDAIAASSYSSSHHFFRHRHTRVSQSVCMCGLARRNVSQNCIALDASGAQRERCVQILRNGRYHLPKYQTLCRAPPLSVFPSCVDGCRVLRA